MSTPAVPAVNTGRNFKRRVTLDGKIYGFWDADELELGSETSEDRDPEMGAVVTAGPQTGGDLPCSRLWDRVRDTPIFKELSPKRGVARGTVDLFEFDDLGVQVGTTPISSRACLMTSITEPPADSKASESARITMTLKVQA